MVENSYGGMKSNWNNKEIVNFWNMIMYNAFNMCIIEPPSIIYQEDVMYKYKSCTKLDKDWEKLGIYELFLEL